MTLALSTSLVPHMTFHVVRLKMLMPPDYVLLTCSEAPSSFTGVNCSLLYSEKELFQRNQEM